VRLSLEVHRDNAGAIKTYRGFGFADAERTNAAGEIWYFVKQL
jgi:ribosomal protein S18 acetylase RimI-like enzyme